jgi:hypothetical protein
MTNQSRKGAPVTVHENQPPQIEFKWRGMLVDDGDGNAHPEGEIQLRTEAVPLFVRKLRWPSVQVGRLLNPETQVIRRVSDNGFSQETNR